MLQSVDKLYGDLTGYWANESPWETIPPELLCTTGRPDIVIVTSEKVIMMELTVPSNTSESLRQAHARKIAKENYQMLQTDLEDKGFHNCGSGCPGSLYAALSLP